MYKSDFEIKKELCEIGRRIYNDGFVAANDGNFSVKMWKIAKIIERCYILNTI
mgnify:CR=1 FL=1